ncbi:hypothetical protein PHSY_007327 [Pseudozyma hubeiensis SY62]|uniref:Uncharacterized protein n=1 Tax=Pseudozyma hubeiensis (strain SY62) TaxID=1305764 RepID=R9PED7_PSEHS|nr:hypothetical protein PHSY_007327 [Pseudozyma hubeiensis SY62]GAC99724.1 hypothetical protein PHSY_007327 [Pseudozyma hubeiensis SY62]
MPYAKRGSRLRKRVWRCKLTDGSKFEAAFADRSLDPRTQSLRIPGHYPALSKLRAWLDTHEQKICSIGTRGGDVPASLGAQISWTEICRARKPSSKIVSAVASFESVPLNCHLGYALEGFQNLYNEDAMRTSSLLR